MVCDSDALLYSLTHPSGGRGRGASGTAAANSAAGAGRGRGTGGPVVAEDKGGVGDAKPVPSVCAQQLLLG